MQFVLCFCLRVMVFEVSFQTKITLIVHTCCVCVCVCVYACVCVCEAKFTKFCHVYFHSRCTSGVSSCCSLSVWYIPTCPRDNQLIRDSDQRYLGTRTPNALR